MFYAKPDPAPFPIEGSPRSPRVLIYSHDTFGLGHLRRSRAIANALVQGNPDASVVIITGSPVVGSFDFGNGVDFVRVPGVVKLPNGDYTSLNLNLGLDEAVALRQGIIASTAATFDPDLIIVDKEPTGFRGEILPMLRAAKDRGTRLVLGIRDVMDEPEALRTEWERKGAAEALQDFYDDVWIYGLAELYRPLDALDLPATVQDRFVYTGYLRRELPDAPQMPPHPRLTRNPFVLVTTGGGGDGHDLIDWVIAAYESKADIPLPALVVFGPFIPHEIRRRFLERIARLEKVEAISFDAKIEHLMKKARAIVAMGGYNTFCEILSLDKPALIVPRKSPRLEQAIRAQCAERLGLVHQLDGLDSPAGARRDPRQMAQAIAALCQQPPPSQAFVPGLLDGLPRIMDITRPWLDRARHGRPLARAVDCAAE